MGTRHPGGYNGTMATTPRKGPALFDVAAAVAPDSAQESVAEFLAGAAYQRAGELARVTLLTHDEALRARDDVVAFLRLVLDLDVQPVQERWARALIRPNSSTVIIGAKGHGKTAIMEGVAAWVIGTVPDARGAFIGPKATDSLRVVADLITGDGDASRRYREVFPHVVPATGDMAGWSTAGNEPAITVEREGRARLFKDPTWQARPLGSGRIQGGRYTHILVDDPTNIDDVVSALTRSRRLDVIDTQVASRATRAIGGQGNTIAVLANAWHIRDAAHILSARPEWEAMRDPAGRRVPVLGPDGRPEQDEHGREKHRWVDLLWPRDARGFGFTSDDLEAEHRRMGPWGGPAMLECRPPSDSHSRFRLEWFERAWARAEQIAPAIATARASGWDRWIVRQGVDLAFSTSGAGDYDAIADSARPPMPIDSPSGPAMFVLLEVRKGHWQGHELIAHLSAGLERYGKAWAALVEENNAKHFLEQARAELPAARVQSRQTTAARKWSDTTGIEAWAASLARDEWAIVRNPGTEQLALACVAYTPREHTPDDVIAAWLSAEAVMTAAATYTEPDKIDRRYRGECLSLVSQEW